MSVTSKIGSRFQAEFISRIIGVISGALLTILLARLLEPDLYGLLFLALSVFGVAKEFSTFGIHKSAGRFISEYKEKESEQIPHILRLSFFITIGFIAIVSGILLFGNQLIADVIGEPKLSQYLIFGSIYIIFSTLAAFARVITQGFEKIRVSAVLFGLLNTTRVVFVVGFVILGFGAFGAFVGYIISSAIVSIVGIGYIYLYIYRQYPSVSIDAGLRTKLVKYSVPIAVTQSAHTLDYYVDRILVGFFLGPVAVAYYTIGEQIVQIIKTPMSALGFTLSPTYSSKKAAGEIDTAATIYEEACGYGLIFYIPAATGIVILADPGVTLVLGDDYRGAVPVLQILSFYGIVSALTNITGEGLDYLGQARSRAIVKAFTGILNVLLNIALIPAIGVSGAAIALVISFTIYTLFNIYIMYLEVRFDVRYILNRLLHAVGISGVMAAVVIPGSQYINGIATLAIVVVVGICIWFIQLLYFGLIDMEQVSAVL